MDQGFSAWATLLGFALSVLCIIFSPSVSIFGRKVSLDFGSGPPLIVLILLITTVVPLHALQLGIIGDDNIQPYQILILFFSLAYVCISIDLTGIFSAVALWAAQKAGQKPLRLFLAFFALSSALTVVTSNDIVILVITPILIECCKSLNLEPFPFLMGQFLAANTLSTIFIISNPTNLIIAGAQGITFAEYLKWMLLPTIVAGLVCLAALYAYYRKTLSSDGSSANITADAVVSKPSPWTAINDTKSAIFGMSVLSIVLVLLAVGPYLGLSMATVTGAAGLLMVVKDVASDVGKSGGSVVKMVARTWRGNPRPLAASPQPLDAARSPPPLTAPAQQADSATSTGVAAAAAFTPVFMPQSALSPNDGESDTSTHLLAPPETAAPTVTGSAAPPPLLFRSVLERMPWKLFPFVVSMFTLVEALSSGGWVSMLALFLASATAGSSPVVASLFMLTVSSLACNLLNNQPMSVLFSRAVLDPAFVNAFAAKLPGGESGPVPLAQVRAMPAFQACIYSLVAGSNFGANITLIGALAGIMWSAQAKAKGVTITYAAFAKVGGLMMVPVIAATALAIGLELQ